MMNEASKVVERLERRIYDAAEAKAEAQIKEVARVVDGLGAVFSGCYRTQGVRGLMLSGLRHALIERYAGEMTEELVGKLIGPLADA